MRSRTIPYSRYATYALEFAVLFAAYFITGRLGLSLDAVSGFAAPIWPPTGLSIAALYLLGYRLFPAVALGAFTVNFVEGAPTLAALGIAIGNSGEALLMAYLLRTSGFNPLFNRLRDSILLLLSAMCATILSASIGVFSLSVAGVIADGVPLTWFSWWIGDLLSAIVIAPLIIRWFYRPMQLSFRNARQLLEASVFFIVLITITILVFWEPIEGLPTFVALPFLIFIPLMWGALRVGPRIAFLAVATMATIAIVGTVRSQGPFFLAGPESLITLQLFVGTVAIIILILVAAVEERKEALKQLEEDVVSLAEDVVEISAADHAKNEFLAILSHELRNPLAPVMSSLELLRTPGGAGNMQAVHTAYEHLQRMTRLLDDLLDISRITQQKFSLHREIIPLRELIDRCVEMVEPMIKSRGHQLSLSLPVDAVYLDADPVRVEQIIVNILNNAAKYTDPGGRITLDALREGENLRIRVVDTGIGIRKDELEIIFEPFRQVAGHNRAGLGLGLSLTKQLTEMHGGNISVWSDGPGLGSEFTVTLPLPDQDVARMKYTQSRKHEDTLDSRVARRILVVDDNEGAANSLAQLLAQRGHTVEQAFSAKEVLEKVRACDPEIILLDIGLPDMSGYELAPHIRERCPGAKIIAVTGYGQDEDKAKAQAAGFSYHLVKPVRIHDLEQAVTAAFSNKTT